MPLKQHPVPQHISSYEFRLIGDMTLKQFGYLAAGAIIGLIIYSLPLPGIFKWPLVFLVGFIGFALAFLPFEERPLLTWITAFFKSVFSPTLFIWKKQPEPPAIFAPRAPLSKKKPPASSKKTAMKQYLARFPDKTKKALPVDSSDKIEQSETEFVNNVNQLFKTTAVPVPKQTPNAPPAQQPAPPPAQPIQASSQQPAGPLPIQQQAENYFRRRNQPKNFRSPVRIINKPIKAQEKAIFRTIPKPVKPVPGQGLPFPQPPTQPNILVGMVLDQENHIIEGAILEIRNQQGIPVRAFKTNKLGQFTIATPLANGTYEIETEKEGLQFDIIKIKTKGKIIPPIKIKAK